FLDEGAREVPLSYYHRTGPVGRIYRAYNDDPKRPFAVIGLGTGTMSCYGLKGQRVDFYDIDPVVVKISFDTNEYFTFIEDAAARGVAGGLAPGAPRAAGPRRPGPGAAAPKADAPPLRPEAGRAAVRPAVDRARALPADGCGRLQQRRHPHPPDHPRGDR